MKHRYVYAPMNKNTKCTGYAEKYTCKKANVCYHNGGERSAS